MDSLTQIVLGAAVGGAVLAPRQARRGLVLGAVCGTLPDLDVIVPFPDPVTFFTYHRSVTHSFFYLTLATPLIVLLARRFAPPLLEEPKKLWAAAWLALVTHPLLDCFTVYGTQALLPFSNEPIAWATVFIIDPAYTAPLIVACILAWRRPPTARKACAWGLALSSLYLGWTVVAKVGAGRTMWAAIESRGLEAEAALIQPAPFNSLLWRAVVMQPEGYLEGFYSVLDSEEDLGFRSYPSRPELLDDIAGEWAVERLRWFTKGFYRVDERAGVVRITDVRMGVEPYYIFSFEVGRRRDGQTVSAPAARTESAQPTAAQVSWVWRRIWNGAAAGSAPTTP